MSGTALRQRPALWTAFVVSWALGGAASAQIAPPAENGIVLKEDADHAEIVAVAGLVRPSHRQLRWHATSLTGFVQLASTARLEVGADEFSPAPASWVAALRAAGVATVVLACRGANGYCLWPSPAAERSVRDSSWRDGKGDLVRDVARACAEGGIGFGISLAFDDDATRAAPSAESPERFRRQLVELLRGYGAIDQVWLDLESELGSELDRTRLLGAVRELQPGAVICGRSGPDVRTTSPGASKTVWNVVPIATRDGRDAADSAEVASAFTRLGTRGAGLGARDTLVGATRLSWCPSAVRTALGRPREGGGRDAVSLATLVEAYDDTVGRNSHLVLDVVVDAEGRLPAVERDLLASFGEVIDRSFSTPVARGDRVRNRGDVVERLFEEPVAFDTVVLREDLRATGQRIEAFRIDALRDRAWHEVARGTFVGGARMLRFAPIRGRGLRYCIERHRGSPTISEFSAFLRGRLPIPPSIARSESGEVTLTADRDSAIYYSLDGTDPGPGSSFYRKPFALPGGGLVKARAIPRDTQTLFFPRETLAVASFGVARTEVPAADRGR